MTSLEIDIQPHEKDPGITVVGLDGELDTYTCFQFKEALQKIMGEGNQKILLEFSKLNFISSLGLSLLIGMVDDLAETGGRLHICNAKTDIWKIFEMAGVSALFDNISPIDEAPSHF